MKWKLLLVSMFMLEITASSIYAQTWTRTTAGTFSWNDATNWNTGVIPNSAGTVANFTTLGGPATQSINLGSNIILGGLNLSNSSTSYTIGGTFSFVFNNGASAATINVGSGSLAQTINANLSLATTHTGGLTINNQGNGLLTLGGKITLDLTQTNVLTFTGTQAITVTGDIDYASQTAITNNSSGLLTVTNVTNSGNFAVAFGGTGNILANGILTGSGSIRQQGTGTLTIVQAINNTNTLQFDAASGTTIMNGAITGTGTVSKIGAGILTLNGASNYSGSVTFSGGQVNLNSATAIGTGSLSIAAPTSIDNTSGAAISLTRSSGTNLNPISFDLTFIGSNALSMGTEGYSLGSGTRTITTNASTLTFATLSGAAGLTKAGAGTLLVGATTNTGANTVSGGTMTVSGAFGAGNLAINNSNTGAGNSVILNLNGSTYSVGLLASSLSAPSSGTNSATLNLGSGSILTTNISANTTFAGNITGGGSLIKNGVNTWILSGNNTYSGTTSITSGSLILSAAAIATGSGTVPTNFLPATTNVTLANGSSVTLQGMASGSTSVSQTIAGLTVSAGVSSVILNPGTSANVTFNLGTISHLAGGILTLNSSNGVATLLGGGNANFAGGQQSILGGYAVINTNWAQAGVGSVAGNITEYSGYTNSYTSTKDVDAPIGSSTVIAGFSTNSVRWNATGGGTFHLNNSGTTTIATGGLFVTSSLSTVSVNINGGQITSGNGEDLIIQQYSAQPLMVNSVISGNIGLTKAGNGTLILAGTNTFTGQTFLLGGTTSVPNLGSTTVAGAFGAAGSSTTFISSATLQYTGTGQTTNRIIRIGTGTATIDNAGTGPLNLTDTGTLTSGASIGTRTLVLTGSYRGTNSLASILTDNGGVTSLTVNTTLPADQPAFMMPVWKLTVANSFTGAVTIAAGHLAISNASALGTQSRTIFIANPSGNSALRLDPGASVSMTVPNMVYSVLSTTPAFYADSGFNTIGLTGGSVNMAAGTGGLVATVASGATLRFNAAIGTSFTGKYITLYGDGDGTIASTITGTTPINKLYSLTKAGGVGTWTLAGASGVNTYTGPTVLVQGGLQIDYSIASVAPTSILSTNSPLVLQGGKFTMIGKLNTSNVMTVSSLSFTGGVSQFTFVQNSATNLTANLGTLGRGSGGLVQFTLPTTGTISISSTNPGVPNAILAYSTGSSPYGTIGTSDWAARDASNNIVALSSIAGGYTASTASVLAGNANVTSGTNTTLAVSTALQSLRVNVAEARTIDLGTKTLTAPGILITPTVGANTTIISNGTLTGAAAPAAVVTTGGSTIFSPSPSNVITYSTLAQVPAIGSLVTGPGIFPNTVVTAVTANTVMLSAQAFSNNSGASYTFTRSEDLTIVQNNTSGGLTINATIADNGAVTNLAKHGDGLLTLGAANTYTGTTIIAGGTIRIATVNALPTNTMLTINDVATAQLDINNLNQTVASLSGGGSVGGKVILGSATLTLSDASNFSTTWKGVISGTGGLNKNVGSGTLFIQNNNTYSGPTAINAGTIVVGNADNFGSLGTGDITIGNGATLAYQRADTITIANNITGGGNFSLIIPPAGTTGSGEGGLTILTGNNSYSGTTTINASTNSMKRLQIGNGGTAGTLGSGNVVNNDQLIGNRSDTLTFQGAISGTGSVTQAGNGVLILNSTNSYTGATNVNRGTLRMGANNAVPSGSAIVINNTVAGTATLDLNNFNLNVSSLTFSGVNAGVQSVTLGSGTLFLDGNIRYDSRNSPAGATITATTGAIALTGNRVIAVDQSPNSLDFDLNIIAQITGLFGIDKQNAGTLVLSAANTYSGGTTITSGMIRVNNTSGSGTGSGGVSVGGGGGVGGGGSIVPNTGSTATNTVTIHGRIAPGNSAGTLTIGSASSNATALIDGTYNFELSSVGSTAGYGTGNSTAGGAVHDMIVVNGSLNIANSHITIASLGNTGFNSTQSYSWTIATATGGITGSPPTIDSISGANFATANPANFSLTSDGSKLTLNYTTNPVPEPLGLMAIATGIFLAGRRFRRRA